MNMKIEKFETTVEETMSLNEESIDIQTILPILHDGDLLEFESEIDSQENHKIRVYCHNKHIGYLKSGLTTYIVNFVESHENCDIEGEILKITGGENGLNYGCKICVELKCYDEEKNSKTQNKIDQLPETFCVKCGNKFRGNFCTKCGTPSYFNTPKSASNVPVKSTAPLQVNVIQQNAIVNNQFGPSIVCPVCGAKNIEISLQQVSSKTAKKRNSIIRSAGRGGMILMTGGLWALTPKADGKEKTKVKNGKFAICQSCGHSWEIKK